MARHARRDLAFERLDHIVGVGSGPVPEQRGDPRQLVARKLQSNESVVEIGRFGISGDGVDFRIVFSEGNLEGGGKIRIGDLFEFGQAEGGVPVKNGDADAVMKGSLSCCPM
jgi:hypothetical protein